MEKRHHSRAGFALSSDFKSFALGSVKPKREQTRHGPDRSMPLAITAVRRVGRADKISFRPRLLYPAFFFGPRGSGAHHQCMVNRSSGANQIGRRAPIFRGARTLSGLIGRTLFGLQKVTVEKKSNDLNYLYGGRTRTRTLDPLIKSHMFNVTLQRLRWKIYENRSIAHQCVRSKKENDCTKRLTASKRRRERRGRHQFRRRHRSVDANDPDGRQVMSACTRPPRSGRGGRRFKSCHSDQHLAKLSVPFGTTSGTDTPIATAVRSPRDATR
jgi:hypothetical protein